MTAHFLEEATDWLREQANAIENENSFDSIIRVLRDAADFIEDAQESDQ